MAEQSLAPEEQPRIRYIALMGLTTIAAGATFYHYIEEWSWIDSLYFSVVTLSTVGYGDITPQSDEAKLFTIFYIIIGIGIFAAVVNFLIKRAAVHRIQKRLARKKKHEN